MNYKTLLIVMRNIYLFGFNLMPAASEVYRPKSCIFVRPYNGSQIIISSLFYKPVIPTGSTINNI